MKLFRLRSDGVYCKFEGLTADAVASLLADLGMTGDEITDAAYEAAIAAES